MAQVTGQTSAGAWRQTGSGMEKCIEQCMECHAVCLSTMQYCLGKGGRHAERNHIGLLADCEQICQTSADFLLRTSPRHAQTCGLCAAVCEECANDCDKMMEDKIMKQCADACRRCADSCRQMSLH